jgi:CelD/BcsL family acetyltransferase involved in cellulose biosynthesis
MTVVQVRRLPSSEWQQDASLGKQWNELLARSEDRSVFLSWEWATTWWDVYGSGFEPLVLAAFDDDGTLCGLSPFMVGRDGGFVSRQLRRLMPIGQPSYSEYPDIILAAGTEQAVVPAILEYLRDPAGHEWDVLVMQRMLAASPTVAMVPAILGDTARVEAVPRSGAPYLSLASSWDEYLQSKSSNFRQMYRNSLGRLERSGKIRILVAEHDIGFDAAFDHLIRLHGMRFDGGSFARPGYADFHRAFARKMLARDGLYLAILTLDDQPIAARYDFVHGSKMWQHQGGWDSDFASMRPGTVTIGAAIQWAIDRGLREYDFLAGDHGYKQRWASGERALVNLVAVNRQTLRGRGYAALRA